MRIHLLAKLLFLAAVLSVPLPAPGEDSAQIVAKEEMPEILFVCEHGAAKSVIAAAYFDKLSKERGLKYRAVFRGTNPDPALAPVAENGLKEDGISTRGWKPEIVTKKDMDQALRIVTLGCALPGKDAVAGKVEEWNDISSVSENYQVARNEIVRKVQSLVDDLAMKEQRRNEKKKTTP